MKKRKNQERLNAYVSEEIYGKIKDQAIKRNITVTLWLSRAIIKELITQRAFEE